MTGHRMRRAIALLISAALLASLAAASLAAPVSAAKPKCLGRTATIVGTNKGEVIRGTARADVIVARGGHDQIYGRGGNDVICGNGGHDRIYGGAGRDLLLGQVGRDRLFGGPGPDRLLGGPDDDSLSGGIGVDLCAQGTGSGPRVACERPPVAVAPPAPAPAPTPPRTLVIAYSDLNGNDAFDAADVLISQVLDTDGNDVPGPGDTIEMGWFPITPTPTSKSQFLAWGEPRHIIATVVQQDSDYLGVSSTTGGFHGWAAHGAGRGDQYFEQVGTYWSSIYDDPERGPFVDDDYVKTDQASPSRPPITDYFGAKGDLDDPLIDVDILWGAPVL